MITRLNDMNEEILTELATLYMEVYKELPWKEEWKHRDALSRLKDLCDYYRSFVIVYYHKKDIVGCAICVIQKWYKGDQIEIKEIFVNQGFHNQGIGSKILKEIEVVSHEIGCNEIILWTANNEKLIKFYGINGFNRDIEIIRMSMDTEKHLMN